MSQHEAGSLGRVLQRRESSSQGGGSSLSSEGFKQAPEVPLASGEVWLDSPESLQGM